MGSPKSDPNPDRRLTALARILKTLRETDEPGQMVSAVLDHLQGELHYGLLWLSTYDRVNHRLLPQGSRSPKKDRLLDIPIDLSPGDLMEQVVIQQRPMIVNDLRLEPRVSNWNQLAERLGIQGALLFPLRRRDACHGLLLLGTTQWGQSPSSSDRTYISTLLSTLADALHHHEQIQQQRAIKTPELPIFNLVNRFNELTVLADQLEAIVQTAHQFMAPDRTRLFWFDAKGFIFWERMTLQAAKGSSCRHFEADTTPLSLPADTIRGVYQSLCGNTLVTVGESEGLLVMNIPEQFMRALQARSLLATPILSQGDLQGFITTEGREPRLWTTAEKDFMVAVGHLAGLMVPASTLTDTLSQGEADQKFLTRIVRSIRNDSDWRKTLETCGEKLCERLTAQQFIVLLYDSDRGGYEVAFQGGGSGRRGTTLVWTSLDEVDWQMMERSTTAIAINDLTDDLKLMAWRDNFQTLGIQSLLACNVSPGHAPEAVILVAAATARHWTLVEGDFLMAVGQQLALILHQWQLQRQVNQQGRLYDSIQWGLRTLQRTFHPDQLEESACRHLADLLKVSLAALVHWDIGDEVARVGQFTARHKSFQVQVGVDIPLASDAVIHWALQTDGLIPVTLEDFPPTTLDWITAPPGSKFLLMALRTAPDHLPNAVLILADGSDRKWSDYHMGLVTLLGNQLAWSRRHLSLMEMLLGQREELSKLNWYKHKRFDEVHRRLEISLNRLSNDVGSEVNSALVIQRQQQTVRQLVNLSQGIATMLEQEQWQLQSTPQTTPLISLLNRLMERAGPLIRERHLWSKVHNDSNVIVGGDIVKIEFVLYDLLLAACERSPEQGRIDIWCRPLDRNSLELSITDDGEVPDQLLSELENGRPVDSLVPSTLDHPPGLHFAICQAIMQQVGGEFSLYRLEDNRMMSRVVLAIANKATTPGLDSDGPNQRSFSRDLG